MNHLNKRRDELAEGHKFNCLRLRYMVRSDVHPSMHDKMCEYVGHDFKIGFDAALSELKPEIDRPVEALEFYADERRPIEDGVGKFAREALQRWREFKGDE